MSTDLYDADLERRYRATAASNIVLPKRWPIGCSGAANAFLATIGPSMGAPTGDEPVQPGGPNRPEGVEMRIGPNVMTFAWGRFLPDGSRAKDHRTDRWISLCSAMLGGDRYAFALTAVLDLDWRHSAQEEAVEREHRAEGWVRYVWPLLPELRPRLVAPLTNGVWNTVFNTINQYRIPFPPYPFLESLAREPCFFRLPGCDFPSMLVKPHNHPSRHFLLPRHIAAVGKACQWFLRASASWSPPSGRGDSRISIEK
jgi:hypothetical protein